MQRTWPNTRSKHHSSRLKPFEEKYEFQDEAQVLTKDRSPMKHSRGKWLLESLSRLLDDSWERQTATCPSTGNCCAGPRALCFVRHSPRTYLFCKKDTWASSLLKLSYRMHHATVAIAEAVLHATLTLQSTLHSLTTISASPPTLVTFHGCNTEKTNTDTAKQN